MKDYFDRSPASAISFPPSSVGAAEQGACRAFAGQAGAPPEKSSLFPCLAAVFIFSLQFLTIPLLGDVDQVGKGLAATFFILTVLLLLLRRSASLSISPVMFLLLAVWGGLFVSGWQAVLPYEAIISVAYLGVLILFCATVTHFAGKHSALIDWVINGLLLSGVVASALGLYEYVRYALFGQARTMVIPYLLPPDANPRVDGMFGQPNLFALFLTLVLLGFFYHYLHRPFPSLRRTGGLRFVPVFLVAMTLFLTGSRGGMLSFFLIFLLLGALVAKGRYLTENRGAKREFLFLCATVALAFLVGYLISIGYFRPTGVSLASTASARLQDVTGSNTDKRFLFWFTALAIFLDHPWLGIGLDNFKLVSVSYRNAGTELLGYADFDSFGYSKWAHNELLQLLSEGGVVTILSVLLLLGLFCLTFWRRVWRSTSEREPFFLYSHLFILPFILQSMLEWPLRHASLLVLFFAFVGLLLAQYRTKQVQLTAVARKSLGLLLIACLVIAGTLLWQEVKLGAFYRNHGDGPGTPEKLAALEQVCRSPFTELRVLGEAIPRFTELAMQSEVDGFARGLLPFAERLTALQSHESHWLNLALLYFRVGENEKAVATVQKSIDLLPNYGIAWSFQHYLNMHAAARATGRPLEEFYPNPPGGHYEVPEMFRVGNRAAQRQ